MFKFLDDLVEATSPQDQDLILTRQGNVDKKQTIGALKTVIRSGLEPSFSKNSGFNLSLGTTAGSVSEGNHLHSQYSETTHVHSYEPIIVKASAFNKDFGTTPGTVSEGNHVHSLDDVYNNGSSVEVDSTNVEFNLSNSKSFKVFSTVDSNMEFISSIDDNVASIGISATNINITGFENTALHGGELMLLDNRTGSPIYLTDSVNSVLPEGATSIVGGVVAAYNKLHEGVYEPVIVKATGFNLALGTTAGTVSEGNHLHAQYSETSHLHTGVYEPVITKATGFNLALGTTEGTVSEGNHSHNDVYYTETEITTLLNGYSLTSHNHSGTYEPIITKETGFNLALGTTVGTVSEGNHLHSQYSEISHLHTGIYEPVVTKATGFNLDLGTAMGTVSEGNHLHTGVYEPVIVKETGFNLPLGTTAGTISEGNHSHSTMILPVVTEQPTDTPEIGTMRFESAGALWIYSDSGWLQFTPTV